MRRTQLLTTLARLRRYTSYLEIGVRDGGNIRHIHTQIRHGVDPEPNRYVTHQMTSDAFFEEHCDRTYDLIFIDGLHHADQVERDIANAVKHVTPGGAIVVHDCNPPEEKWQVVPRQQQRWNGDVWKAWVRFMHGTDHRTLTINADEGLGVIDPRLPAQAKIDVPEQLTYAWLDENREQALRLTQPHHALQLLTFRA